MLGKHRRHKYARTFVIKNYCVYWQLYILPALVLWKTYENNNSDMRVEISSLLNKTVILSVGNEETYVLPYLTLSIEKQ